jgi:hypothetical protein
LNFHKNGVDAGSAMVRIRAMFFARIILQPIPQHKHFTSFDHHYLVKSIGSVTK